MPTWLPDTRLARGVRLEVLSHRALSVDVLEVDGNYIETEQPAWTSSRPHGAQGARRNRIRQGSTDNSPGEECFLFDTRWRASLGNINSDSRCPQTAGKTSPLTLPRPPGWGGVLFLPVAQLLRPARSCSPSTNSPRSTSSARANRATRSIDGLRVPDSRAPMYE